MNICDITMAYGESTGGIKTYIDAKRNYIVQHTNHRHTLIIPGETNETDVSDRCTTIRIKSPQTGYGSYRLMWRPDKIAALLQRSKPDVVELGTFFVCPWPAFHYRRARLKAGRATRVFGYFHTDLADAYFHTPIDQTIEETIGSWSDALASTGTKLADLIGGGAEAYFGSIFKNCDRMFAASREQSGRLRAYGIDNALVVPLGVDAEVFHPGRRDASIRARFSAGHQTAVLTYAGRLDDEKRVLTLVDAFRRLDRAVDYRLVLIGEGPREENLKRYADDDSRIRLLGFVKDKSELASILASSDIYVTAGPHETFGLSVIEAQAAGLPVVCVDAGALVDRVPDGVGLRVPVDDAAAMARAIERAWANRRTLGASARALAEREFSWGASFAHLFRIYETELRTT